jgi:eukaryotic-like serine/threonine-protein kinase
MAGDASTTSIDCAETQPVRERRRTAKELLSSLTPGLSPPCRFAGYGVTRQLGAGKFAVVYLARRLEDQRPVALKVLLPEVEEAPELMGRYLREVEALRELRSPHLVGLVDAGRADGRYFLALELITGRTLAELIEAHTTYPILDTLRLGRDVARGLTELHAHGLLHRDVKPANVMVRPDGTATLVDLGLVKPVEEGDVTASGVIMGTPYYLAPEVVRGEEAGAGSDVYALGITLWQALVGSPPVIGESVYGILEKLALGEPIPEVRTRRPDVPKRVSRLISRATIPDPTQRYSAAALADAIELLLEGLEAESAEDEVEA